MKVSSLGGFGMLVFALTTLSDVGCAAPIKIAEPVGPAPLVDPFWSRGQLVVYTDIRPADDPEFQEPARMDYTIFDTMGHQIRWIYEVGDPPDPVSLHPGDYVIRGKGFGMRKVEVPVRIEAGKTTQVYLDGSAPPSGHSTDSGLVHGPKGSFVGWRADARAQR